MCGNLISYMFLSTEVGIIFNIQAYSVLVEGNTPVQLGG
jgi:hypothetical protein